MWSAVGLAVVVCSVIVVISNLIHGGDYEVDHREERFRPKSNHPDSTKHPQQE